jgi:hypothetical protein
LLSAGNPSALSVSVRQTWLLCRDRKRYRLHRSSTAYSFWSRRCLACCLLGRTCTCLHKWRDKILDLRQRSLARNTGNQFGAIFHLSYHCCASMTAANTEARWLSGVCSPTSPLNCQIFSRWAFQICATDWYMKPIFLWQLGKWVAYAGKRPCFRFLSASWRRLDA